MIAELDRLETIARQSRYAEGSHTAVIDYSFQVFRRFYRTGSILEVGPAEGVMTELLATLGAPLTIVEGSEHFCHDLSARFPLAKVFCALAEDFETDEKFSAILLGHVLEHVENPVAVLRHLARFLAADGFIYAAVPNSRSLHRQAGVILDYLEIEEQMNDLDRHHGHRRVYNPETLRHDFRKAGLALNYFGGFGMKLLANSQTAGLLGPEQLRAFLALGERYPDIASDLYVIAHAGRAGRK